MHGFALIVVLEGQQLLKLVVVRDFLLLGLVVLLRMFAFFDGLLGQKEPAFDRLLRSGSWPATQLVHHKNAFTRKFNFN